MNNNIQKNMNKFYMVFIGIALVILCEIIHSRLSMDLNQKIRIFLMARHEKVEKQFVCCHLYS